MLLILPHPPGLVHAFNAGIDCGTSRMSITYRIQEVVLLLTMFAMVGFAWCLHEL